MSHRHPVDARQHLTSEYNLPTDPVKGEGTINIGEINHIQRKNLKEASPLWEMSAEDLARLLADISTVSNHSTQRGRNYLHL